MNLIRHVFAAVLACLLCGCGTITNTLTTFYDGKPVGSSADDDRLTQYIYGGVKFDAEMIRLGLIGQDDIPLYYRLLVILLIADLPLSAVCDTLRLPETIPAAQHEPERRRKAHESKWADFDDDGNELPAVPAPDAAPELE